MEYKVIKPHNPEEGETEFDSVIEISGTRSEVTIHSLLDHVEFTKKAIEGAKGQIYVNELQMEALEKLYPILKDLPKDKIDSIKAYIDKFMTVIVAKELIRTGEETIKTYMTHLEAVQEATGIKCVPVISPMQLEEVEAGAEALENEEISDEPTA